MMKKKLLLCFFIWVCISLHSQNLQNDTIAQKYILGKMDVIARNSEHTDFENVLAEINQLEKKIDKTKNNNSLILLYRQIIIYLINKHDFESSKMYLNKIEKLLKYNYSKQNLFNYYFSKGYILPKNDVDGKIYWYNKSIELYKNQNNIDLIIPGCAISFLYIKKERYKDALIVSKNVEKILLSEVNKYKTYQPYFFLLHLVSFEANLKLNDINSAAVFHKKILKDDLSYPYEKFYLSSFYDLQALYYLKSNQKHLIENSIWLSRKYALMYLEKERDNLSKISTRIAILNKKQLEETKIKSELINQRYISINILAILLFSLIISILYIINKNKTNNKLNEIINSKKVLIDTISHEIRTPINTLTSLSYLANQNQNLISSKEFIEMISFSSEYLNNLVNNFIDFNDINNNHLKSKKQENPKAFELKNYLKTVFNLNTLEKNNDNNYQLDIDQNLNFSVLSNPNKLTQVFTNLIGNSNKFTKNGTITLIAKLIEKNTDYATVYFEIADTGIGIETDKIKDVFEPFVQGSKEINFSYGGIGLGLSIVKSIITELGGTINIYSKKNEGTKVYFSLNLRLDPNQSIFTSVFVESKSTIKVLLVEDNKINQMLTKKIITNKNYLCDIANDGLEAIQMVKKTSYDIIFMDIMMPNMDGFEATKIIKSKNSTLPIIALSSISEELNEDKIKDANFNKFISKPIDPNQIYDAILEMVKH